MNKKIVNGALILGFSNIITKVLGLFFIFPFYKMVGTAGTALYTYAYVPYVFFIDIFTIGLVPGTSFFVSENNANHHCEANSYFLKRYQLKMLLIGLLGFLLLNIVAPLYSHIAIGEEVIDGLSSADVVMAIRCVSPSLLIVPLLFFYRGFMQGQNKMYPSGISIILEQAIRIVVILGGAFFILHVLNKSINIAVYIAVLAAFFGSLVATFYLFILVKKYKRDDDEKVELNGMFKKFLPIGIATIFLTVYQLIDSTTFNRLLMRYGTSNIKDYYSAYSFQAIRLIIIPVLIVQSIATSSLPNINEMTIKDQSEELKKNIGKIFSMSLFICINCFVITFYFSKEIHHLFYEQNEIGAQVLESSAILIIIFSLYKILISIMNGTHHISILVVTTIIGFIMKLLLNLWWIPKVGFGGAILSSCFSGGLVIVASLLTLSKVRLYSLRQFIRCFLKVIIAALVGILFVVCFRLCFSIPMNEFKSIIVGLGIYGSLYFLASFIFFKILN